MVPIVELTEELQSATNKTPDKDTYHIRSHIDSFPYMTATNQKGAMDIALSEIGTCILDYLSNLPESVMHVSSFSDTCGGQNRNQLTSAVLLYAVNKNKNLQVFDMKFMKSGHSYLEADLMYATIECASKYKTIYMTREWGVLIQMARKKPSNL